jgi:hypothetical protein
MAVPVRFRFRVQKETMTEESCGFFLLGSPVPSDKKIQQGSEEGEEDNEKDPYDLVIPLKTTGQNVDQGNKRKEGYEKDDEKNAHKSPESEETCCHFN